jgi:uncharacterized RDD family membrane protein YckC
MNNSLEISSATGVDLQLNIAGAGARSYAFVIDWHIRVLLAFAWFAVAHLLFVGGATMLDSDAADFDLYVFVVIVPAVCLFVLYHPVLEVLMRGRTPGKRMAGVRVVSLDAQVPGFLSHLTRNILRLLDSLPAGYVIGLVCTLFTRHAVRIGDLAAGTVLIYDSDARGVKLQAPPLDPAAIQQHGLARAELIQDLLDRWDSLEAGKRAELAAKLLAKLAPLQQPAADPVALRAQLTQIPLGTGMK